jgi:hypothetical protein
LKYPFAVVKFIIRDHVHDQQRCARASVCVVRDLRRSVFKLVVDRCRFSPVLFSSKTGYFERDKRSVLENTHGDGSSLVLWKTMFFCSKTVDSINREAKL